MKRFYKRLMFLFFFLIGTYYSHSQVTYNYTGALQTYTVPALVFSLTIDMAGASGGEEVGTSAGPHDPGDGGRVETTLTVTPGDVLNLYVGGRGIDGIVTVIAPGAWPTGGDGGERFAVYAGGSGGGSSDIRIGGTAFADRVIVAGAGGGAAFNYFAGGDHGGDGGDLIADDGLSGGGLLGRGGTGGSQVAGGIGGLWPGYLAGADGALGDGGNGGTNGAGGGGGGGYYGGGGGSWGGGGGGSSWTDVAVTAGTTHTKGYQNGDGYITITEISVLPIEITGFYANKEANKVKLSWTTLSERNNASFLIERSTNGTSEWTTIANKTGAGNSSAEIKYTTWDDSPIDGVNYYRLKQIDFDGNYTYYGPISINYFNYSQIRTYPNPAKTYLTVVIPNETVIIEDIRIYDLMGRDLTELVILSNLTTSTIDPIVFGLDINSLSRGKYLIQVNTKMISFIKS